VAGIGNLVAGFVLLTYVSSFADVGQQKNKWRFLGIWWRVIAER
jgi:hypothetical protein